MRLLVTIAASLALATAGLAQEKKTEIKKVPAKYSNPASGPEMFKQYCAPCHGVDGKGTGPAASALKKTPTDLTLLSAKNNGKFPTLKVMNTIQGSDVDASHGSRDMPIWGDIFRSFAGGQMVTEMRVKNLSSHIESMQQK